MADVTDSLPAWIPHPTPAEPLSPTPAQRRVLGAYCAELGIDDATAAYSFMTYVEATRWWNSGAPELYKGPTAAGETLAHYRAVGDLGDVHDTEYMYTLEQQDRAERLARSMPSPDRPGWRAPRSKHAPTVKD